MPSAAKTPAPRARPGPVRLTDVAKRAGVGTSIVSRVLNSDPTVSIRPETRERILTAARELEYRPNAFARGLKLARTMTIGMVIPNLAYPVNVEIIRGADRAAAAAGYVTLLADADEFVETGEAYQRLLLEQRVDGLLIASASTKEPFLMELVEKRLPFVLVNRRVPHFGPCVSADDGRGVAMAVEHLAALGHRRIAHIGGPRDADTARRRLAGFRKGMRAAGLRIRSDQVAEAPYEEEAGKHAMERLLELSPRPTAVVVWSLAAAIGAVAAANERGVAVPGDLSIVGFHDAPIAAYLHPPLTTIRMPLAAMAERSVGVLLDLIDRRQGGGKPRNIVVPGVPVLVERGSTGPPSTVA